MKRDKVYKYINGFPLIIKYKTLNVLDLMAEEGYLKEECKKDKSNKSLNNKHTKYLSNLIKTRLELYNMIIKNEEMLFIMNLFEDISNQGRG